MFSNLLKYQLSPNARIKLPWGWCLLLYADPKSVSKHGKYNMGKNEIRVKL